VVTNKWMRAGYAKGLRGVFADKAWIEFVADFGHAKRFFPDADVFPSVIVIRKPLRSTAPAETEVCVIPRDDIPEKALDEAVAKATYSLPRAHFTSDSWTLEPPDVINLFRKIREGHAALEDFAGVKPLYGIKTGLNEAFLITNETRNRLIAEHASAKEIIKPYLRGQDIERWWSPTPDLWMIFTRRGIEIDAYPSIRNYLAAMRDKLEPKPDDWQPSFHGEKWPGRKAGNYAWYEIQDPVDYHAEFLKPKLLAKRIAFYNEFSLDPDALHVNDSALIIPSTDPWLLTCLNSPLAWYYMFKTFPHKKDEAIALDIPFLRDMPIAEKHKEFDPELVSRIRELRKAFHGTIVQISDWLRVEFGLQKMSRVIAKYIDADADGFVAAVRAEFPKNAKFSAALLSELKREHKATVEPVQQVRAEIFALERKLSDLVNQAYGLTPQEVDLMWRTAPPRMPFTPAGLPSADEGIDEEDADADE